MNIYLRQIFISTMRLRRNIKQYFTQIARKQIIRKKPFFALCKVYAGLTLIWPKLSSESKMNIKHSLLDNADKIYENGRYEECYNLLVSSKEENNVEIKWRICRALYNMSKDQKYEASYKQQLISRAYKMIATELEKHWENCEVQKWLTLKEVKKRIFMDVNQKYLSRLASCDEKYNDGNDFKIIETSSQPNMLAANGDGDGLTEHLKSTSDPCFNRNKHNIDIHLKIRADPDCENRDSFLEMEEKVTEQCKYAYKCDNNLDNTLEFVDFILNHAQSQEKNIKATNIIEQESCENNKTCIKDDEAPMNENLSQSRAHNSQNDEKTYKEHDDNIEKLIHIPTTPIKCDQIETLSISKNLKPESASALNTPVSIKNQVSNVFKTPKIPLSSTKDSGAKKIPSRSKAYEHIVSPIATYIRNSPQVPLVKHVHPKKPLPSTSLIPKLLKNNPELKSDKENVVLPQLAYRNAKKTLVIDVNKEKLPQSNWAQKLTPMKPIVLKHNHREGGKIPLSLQQQQEDSFQDLTLHQADVSVCTQKLAFQK